MAQARRVGAWPLEYRNTTSLTSGGSGAEPHSSYDRDPPVNAGAERGAGGNGKQEDQRGRNGPDAVHARPASWLVPRPSRV